MRDVRSLFGPDNANFAKEREAAIGGTISILWAANSAIAFLIRQGKYATRAIAFLRTRRKNAFVRFQSSVSLEVPRPRNLTIKKPLCYDSVSFYSKLFKSTLLQKCSWNFLSAEPSEDKAALKDLIRTG